MGSTKFPDAFTWYVSASPQLRLQWALAICLWITFIYFGSTPSWNPNTRFDLVRAMVERQTFSINAYHENTGDKSRDQDRYYSDKAPGLSFLTSPIYGLAYGMSLLDTKKPQPRSLLAPNSLYLTTILSVAVLSAILAAVLLAVCLHLGASAKSALFIVLIYALGTPALPYSTLFFAHQVAGALLFIAFALLMFSKKEPVPFRLVAVGLCLGWAIISEYPAGLGVLAILGYLWWRFVKGRSSKVGFTTLVWLSLGFALPIGLDAFYNTICFNAPWNIGYGILVPSRFSEGMSKGFFGISQFSWDSWLGISFGTKRGLFFVAPILLPALMGLIQAVKKSSWRAEAFTASAIVVAFFILNASYVFWDGGAAYGPRHMVPMLPFLTLGLLHIPWKDHWKPLWVILAVFSIANAVAATAVGADLPEYGNILFQHIWPHILANQFPVERWAFNLGQVLGLTGVFSLVPLFLFWACAFPLLWNLITPKTYQEKNHAD